MLIDAGVGVKAPYISEVRPRAGGLRLALRTSPPAVLLALLFWKPRLARDERYASFTQRFSN